jgi:hypothetical protein
VIGNAVIENRTALAEVLRDLPDRVVKKIMDRWVLKNAQLAAAAGRAAAPRDRSPYRRKPESARLWKIIKSSRVRRPRNKMDVSRAIAFGARSTYRYSATRRAAALKGNARRKTRGVTFGPSAPRAMHFAIINSGAGRRQTRAGHNRGVGPANPFFGRAVRPIMAAAASEAMGPIRVAYDQAIQAELRRLARR